MAPTSPRRFSLILSQDIGCDDAAAILLALTSPHLDVLAVVPQFGNTDLSYTYSNTLKLYGVLDRHFKAVPGDKAQFPATQSSRKPVLVKGAAGPLEGQGHTAKYFHGSVSTSSCSHISPSPSATARMQNSR